MANYSHDAGTSGTVTVPAGRHVRRYSCVSAGGGAIIITLPHGVGAQSTITLPAGQYFTDEFSSRPDDLDTELPSGTTIAFSGTDSYFVRYG